MKLNYLPYTPNGLNGTEAVPLVGISALTEYVDGKPTDKQIGFSYDILLLDQACEKLRVKVKNLTPICQQEELDTANATANFIVVKFDRLEIKPYSSSNGRIAYTARADSVEVVGTIGSQNGKDVADYETQI